MNNKQAKIILKILKSKGIDIASDEGRKAYKDVKRYITNNKAEDKLANKEERKAKTQS